MEGLAHAFGQDPPDLGRAKMLAIEMQYLKNLERAAREWQPGKRVEVIH
jgi:molecular chaperone HscB